jgi:DNA-binding response OmpR family regulator
MAEAKMLQKHGYGVITVYNAEKAIETAKQDDIDLILMDIDLGRNSIGRNTTVISTALH